MDQLVSPDEMTGARTELTAVGRGGTIGGSTAVEERRAVRFFWAVLVLASLTSVAGNVTHAVWNAAGPAMIVAAVAALVTGKRRCQFSPNSCSRRRLLRSRAGSARAGR